MYVVFCMSKTVYTMTTDNLSLSLFIVAGRLLEGIHVLFTEMTHQSRLTCQPGSEISHNNAVDSQVLLRDLWCSFVNVLT